MLEAWMAETRRCCLISSLIAIDAGSTASYNATKSSGGGWCRAAMCCTVFPHAAALSLHTQGAVGCYATAMGLLATSICDTVESQFCSAVTILHSNTVLRLVTIHTTPNKSHQQPIRTLNNPKAVRAVGTHQTCINLHQNNGGPSRGPPSDVMASKDPYYLVRDDIQTSVRASHLAPCSTCSPSRVQLDKVQSIFATWQGMSKNTAQATNLMHDIEEECSSIQWQVCNERPPRLSSIFWHPGG